MGLLLGLYLLLNFLIWTQLTRQIESDRNETISAAIQHSSNLAIALEQHTIRTVRDADATLRLIKAEYLQQGHKLDLNRMLNSGVLSVPAFNGLIITDSTGKVVLGYPLRLVSLNLNIGDRPFFAIHKKTPDSLVMTKPYMSRSLKQNVIVFSRGIRDNRGRFRGCIAIQLLPSNFMSFYSQASLNENDILSLISPDGITYSRRTGMKESSGENIRKSPLFGHVGERPIGNYYARDAIRNIPTFFSYRKLKFLPIIATVGTSESDVLAKFHLRAKREYFFGAAISLLLFIFLLAVFIAFRERKRTLKVVKVSEAKYRSIFESSQDAILLLQPDGYVQDMNPAAIRMFGLSVMNGQNISFLQLFAKAEPEVDWVNEEGTGLRLQDNEVLFHCLNGGKFIGYISSSPLQDGRDQKNTLVIIRDITQHKRITQKLQNEQKRYQRILTKQIIVAQERERESIGHELHDNVNQILTTVKLYLETALQREEGRQEWIRRSIDFLMLCIKEIRSLSHSLSAPTLGTKSLIDSLQALFENVSDCTTLNIDFTVGKYRHPIGKEVSLALYRIAQEQITNVVKHAKATTVKVSLSQTETETHLVIEDNGRGFEPGGQYSGIGLNNISSRVKAFNGKHSIQSAPGKGCRLSVHLPHVDELELVDSDWN